MLSPTVTEKQQMRQQRQELSKRKHTVPERFVVTSAAAGLKVATVDDGLRQKYGRAFGTKYRSVSLKESAF